MRSQVQTWLGCLILSCLGVSCAQPSLEEAQADSEIMGGISGRTSMGKHDPTQCFNKEYSGPERIRGKLVAGLDGTTFGSKDNGVITPLCGTTFTVRNKKMNKSLEFIVADRIWENDGVTGQRFNNEENAKKKLGGVGAGYSQIDIAVEGFNELFGGHNPAEGDFEILGLPGFGGSPRAMPSVQGAPQMKQAATNQGGRWCDGSQCFPTCTNGSNTGGGFGWQPGLEGAVNGGSCRAADASVQSQAASPNQPKASGDGDKFCDQGVCYPYCTNGSNTGGGFGWQPEIKDAPKGGSCKVR